ncbi:choline/ethanolaminephosphotransferase 1 isoform X6 [Ceratina calcarata]|uniref:diacylglycerol cholinephosphotransferase n=1 Tax=Ceratina calcarata TaxID=156304 RepID=A0AAJ7WEY9_9HYME|nr:choline/ethanolaminephosphotransferase 1 isoform X6 [Ceratina calcarata]
MQFYKEKLLSPGQLKRLSEHKYSCSTNSLLDGLLQPWWDWLVSKVPLWLAPNLITIVGLIVNIATTLILVYYSPDARTEAPRWACFLCALGLFIYQSLDAIDGKQARRTGTSTPLGELFDHGCDSISTVFIALSACIAVQLGYYPTWMFFQCFCAMTLFYCAHWQTYVSGSLRFGKVDVTEAQFTIIMIHLISAVFGPRVWMMEIPYIDGLMLKYLIGVVTLICALANLYSIFSVIFTGGVGKNGSTVALPYTGTEVKVFPLWAAVGIAILLAQSSISVILAGGVGKNGSTVANAPSDRNTRFCALAQSKYNDEIAAENKSLISFIQAGFSGSKLLQEHHTESFIVSLSPLWLTPFPGYLKVHIGTIIHVFFHSAHFDASFPALNNLSRMTACVHVNRIKVLQ